jgi:hypothetical protein
MRWRMIGLVAAVAAAGCTGGGPAEVPKDPVPMQKPGAAAVPGGAKGNPGQTGGGQPAQPLPR